MKGKNLFLPSLDYAYALMKKHSCLLILLFATTYAPSFAQEWTQEDSLRLQSILAGQDDIEINPKERLNIRLETPLHGIPQENIFEKHYENILKYNCDLPSSFLPNDTFPSSRRIYITLRPYGIFGFTSNTDVLPMAVKIPLRAKQSAGKTPHPTAVSFSMDNILLYSFNLHGNISAYRRNNVYILPSVTKNGSCPSAHKTVCHHCPPLRKRASAAYGPFCGTFPLQGVFCAQSVPCGTRGSAFFSKACMWPK